MHPWEQEYRSPKLVTLYNEPQATVRRFFRYLKKTEKFIWTGKKVVDVGCGTGRNANTLADMGAEVVAFDISPTAILLAKERARKLKLSIDYSVQNMTDKWPLNDISVDVILDVTSSNALASLEREKYLSEVKRVLKTGGWFYLRTLAFEGDHNAKKLLLNNPGSESNRYILPDVEIEETVLTEKEIRFMANTIGGEVKFLKREEGYTSLGGKSFKRQFWIMYFQKA